MNKKYIAIFYLILLSAATILSLYTPKTTRAEEEIVIPHEAIRLRILADSDTAADQKIKREVRDRVNEQITVWVGELTSLKEARKVIKSKLPEIQAIAEKVVAAHKSDQTVNVDFGRVKFPTKLYGQFLYPAGEYEAILITLGKGEGANWWCVLYPPLCFLDFSNGEATSPGFEEKGDNVKSKKEGEENIVEEEAEGKEKADLNKETEARAAAASQPASAPSSPEQSPAEPTPEPATVEPAAQVEIPEAAQPTAIEEPTPTENSEVPLKNLKEQEADTSKVKKVKKSQPVFQGKEEEIEVRFFVVDAWKKLFN
ncbi:stage II sporulation protein R [Bacillus massilinigeriensis]|uniref:stage II sporulation protein R n=1 Tax=Bacillus mediterraneensis TaxID=1805474 RepID=UPI0008F8D628|nr:stage II sporulation protein R [Bacillus mediterraneensis]